jgi:hypothetical protein
MDGTMRQVICVLLAQARLCSYSVDDPKPFA